MTVVEAALALANRVRWRAIDVAALASLRVADPHGYRVLRRLRSDHLTYLRASALADLYRTARAVEAKQLPGDMVEAGCALGGSAIALAAAKAPARSLLVYDAFGMIPPPTERDGDDAQARYRLIASGAATGLGGEAYYGYRSDLLAAVERSFVRYGYPPADHHVRLVPGLYEDSLHPTDPIALAHIDCDWYESVMVCLQRIEPLLVPGGMMIIDDYFDWSGCHRAVDDYFAAKRGGYRFTAKASLHIHKTGLA